MTSLLCLRVEVNLRDVVEITFSVLIVFSCFEKVKQLIK